jgi:hypothetical protein
MKRLVGLLVVLAVCAFVLAGSVRRSPAREQPSGQEGTLRTDKEDPEATKEKVAREKANTISKAVEAFKAAHKVYPLSIEKLIEPDPENDNKPWLKKEEILDPWSKGYQVDLKGPKNKGAKADVFTTTPGGKIIGNWEK